MKPNLYVLSGAGLSADSGLPTFRNSGTATWNHVDVNEVCNFHTWRVNKEAVFDFYRSRRIEYADALPNEGHKVLAEWQQRWGSDRVTTLTQNVDDLLERAGALNVTHLHGNINRLMCTSCDHSWEATIDEYQVHTECPICGSSYNVKPGIVMFNESAPEYEKLVSLQTNIEPQDVFLVVGSTMQVVGLHQCIPYDRITNKHPTNWQVNPEPVYPNSFGVIEVSSAGIGLKNLEHRLVDIM